MEFRSKLSSGKPLVTMDIMPPKGVACAEIFTRLATLRGRVAAINVVDMPSAMMRMSPLPFGGLLKREGFAPILQMTCRDRNRLSLQGDLLGASAWGIETVLALGGDPIRLSDDPSAHAVFDLDSTGLLRAARTLESGVDLAGKTLTGAPAFCLGAACDPGISDLDAEIEKMERKVKAGAEFFQTQPIYDTRAFAGFIEKVAHLGVPILAGIFVLKSARMGRFMNAKVPGVHVPGSIISEMENASDPAGKSVEIAVRTMKILRQVCQGAHIMTIQEEHKITRILDALNT